VKQAVTGNAPGGPYSSGIVAEGRFLFVAGQGPTREGTRAFGTIEEETSLVLDNVGRVLEQAGVTFADVVRCNVYLADLDDFEAMNAVYQTYFPEPRPARTTIGCALRQQMKVEIDCVAVVPTG
jgi:2-iminobutanoate/2-iminopropanoate deaminase